MKTLLTHACFLCSWFPLIAQDLPNSHFNQIETIPCPFDSSTTIMAYVDWVIYQTIDDKWNGPIDSSRCISLEPLSGGIDLASADLTKPLFVRCKLTEDNKVLLQPNKLYNIGSSFHSFPGSIELTGGMGCAENLCTGHIIGIQVPDSTGTTTAMRWHLDVASEPIIVVSSTTSIDWFGTCIATEYFAENYLREFVIKLKPEPSVTPDKKIRMDYTFFEYREPNNVLQQMIAPAWTFVDSSYEVPIYYVADNANGWDYIYMLPYHDQPNWPSSVHPSYSEGRPQTNTVDPKIINILVDENSEFVPQPFAFMRGAFVEGSDSIRHQVNLVNQGGDICMGGDIIDFVFDGGTKYVHQGGHVNFEGRSSCMMFRNGGILEVGDNTVFEFGKEGKGILALRSGGSIRLGKGSTLHIENLLWLQGVPTLKHPDPQFYLDLRPGSSLIFGKNANITNAMSFTDDTRLNIYMNGGVLDDSRLSHEAKRLINRIYPKPLPQFKSNIRVLQNPIHHVLELTYLSSGQEQLQVELFDLQGKNLGKKAFSVSEGLNFLEYDLSALPTGIYFMNAMSGGLKTTVKIIKTGF